MIDTFGKGDPALIARRYRAERRFRAYGAIALGLTALFLAFLIVDIVSKGWPAFFEHRVILKVTIDPAKIDSALPRSGDYQALVKEALRDQFPNVATRGDRKKLSSLLSIGAADDLREKIIATPSFIGTELTVPALLSDDADLYFKDQASGRLSGQEAEWLETLKDRGLIEKGFAWRFFTSGDSREPELAGLQAALVGSLLTIAVTLLLSLPLGVAAAIYLEEFAPKNRFTDLIEVNINNLAAVPSIIF
ncbi:MAG: DUF3333 domain-containing protein, partial [Methylocella sp.]